MIFVLPACWRYISTPCSISIEWLIDMFLQFDSIDNCVCVYCVSGVGSGFVQFSTMCTVWQCGLALVSKGDS